MALFRRRAEKGDGAESPVESAYASGSIELPDVIEAGDESPRKRDELTWGLPSRCPECGDYGYLDKVDVNLGVMYQHCPTCWTKWELTEEEIQAQNA